MYDDKVYESFCKLVNKQINNEYDEKGQVQSTYKADYTVKELPERIRRKVETVVISMPFDDMTTYRKDYKALELPPVERKREVIEKCNLPFEGISTYTSDFSLKAWDFFRKSE